MDHEVDIAERVFELRTAPERGWTQKELATAAGVNETTIVHIETEQVKPRLSTLRRIARAFDMSVEELTGPKPPGPSLPQALLRRRTGHDFLTRSITETVAFATSASQDEIRARLRDLAEEKVVLREAIRHLTEYVPELFGPPLSGKTLPHAKDIEEVKAAKDEIGAVAGGFVVRVKVLAEIGDDKDLITEAERILEAEHAAVY